MKIGLRNNIGKLEKLGVNLQRRISKGTENWFEKLVGLENQGFKKLAFHYILSFFLYFCLFQECLCLFHK